MPTQMDICIKLGLPIPVMVEMDLRTGKIYMPDEIKSFRARAAKKQLSEMKVDEIRWALEHRVEVQ